NLAENLVLNLHQGVDRSVKALFLVVIAVQSQHTRHAGADDNGRRAAIAVVVAIVAIDIGRNGQGNIVVVGEGGGNACQRHSDAVTRGAFGINDVVRRVTGLFKDFFDTLIKSRFLLRLAREWNTANIRRGHNGKF